MSKTKKSAAAEVKTEAAVKNEAAEKAAPAAAVKTGTANKHQKHYSGVTFMIILTVILVIQSLVVLYPIAFTVSGSLTKSNSLASTSIVPFMSVRKSNEKDTMLDSLNALKVLPEEYFAKTGTQVKDLISMTEGYDPEDAVVSVDNKDFAVKMNALADDLAASAQTVYADVAAKDAAAAEKAKTAASNFLEKLKSDSHAAEYLSVADMESAVQEFTGATEVTSDSISTLTNAISNAIYQSQNQKKAKKVSSAVTKALDVALSAKTRINEYNKIAAQVQELKDANSADSTNAVLTDAELIKSLACSVVLFSTGDPVTFSDHLEFKPSLYQYKRLLTDPDELVEGTEDEYGTNYKIWYLNTLKIACMNTIFTVFLCTLAGYIFSRFQFPFRKTIMGSMIVLQMFPSFIGMVATYVILWKINALNTLWGLVLVYAAGSIPFNSWLMKSYFDTIPKDIAEAAYIDGATPFTAFIKVIVPSAKPQIVFLTLTSFTGPWMDFIFPRLILRSDEKKTLAVGLYEMISGRSADKFTMFAAGAILVAVPFTILFMLGQKSLLQSLAGTGGKE